QSRRRQIFGRRGAVGVQAKKTERPGPRRGKALHARQGLAEEAGRPALTQWARAVAGADAQGPERAPMAVLGTGLFEPAAVEAHEVAEPQGVGVPGVLHESREAHRKGLRQACTRRFLERTGQQQGPGIVVKAVAMGAVWRRVDCMLEQAGIV